MKQDLNLIPRKESSHAFQKIVLPILLILLVYCAAMYMGIRIPRSIYRQKDSTNESIKVKIEEMAAVNDEYISVMNSLNFLQSQTATISATSGNEKFVLNVLNTLEDACPQDIKLISLITTDTSISIKGAAPDDTSIAEFVVNLRNSGKFDASNISIIAPSSMITDESGVEQEIRSFTLMLTYPVETLLAEEEQVSGGNE